MRVDLIVAGAGPAGSTCAREAAARGLSVLLLERSAFPRDKPCGGGVNVRAARLLPFPLGPVVEREIRGMRLSLDASRHFTRRYPAPITYLTQRRHLDAFLLERARDAGAQVRTGTAVDGVERTAAGVTVSAGPHRFQGGALVVADGANGPVGRLAGLRIERRLLVGLEANVTPAGGIPRRWWDVFGIELGGIAGGYGWVFPKDDHLNFGWVGALPEGPSLRARLDDLVRRSGFDPETAWGVRGYRLPLRLPGSPLADGPIALVGDAAGLLDPFTGEGIHAAIWSGRAAASHVVELAAGHAVDLSGYARQVARELVPELRTAARVADLFHAWPRPFVAAVRRSPRVFRAGCAMLRGDADYASLRRGLGRGAGALDLASDALRTSPRLQALVGMRDPAPPERFRLGR